MDKDIWNNDEVIVVLLEGPNLPLAQESASAREPVSLQGENDIDPSVISMSQITRNV